MIVVFVLIAVAAGCVSLVFLADFGFFTALALAALAASAVVLAAGVYLFYRKTPQKQRAKAPDLAEYDRLSLGKK